MEALSRAARFFLGVVVAAAFAASELALAAEPPSVYISPAGHNFRAEAMPLHSAKDVTASLELVKALGVKRVYWRGFQEDYLMRHAVVRKANFQLADYWDWMRETSEKGAIHKAALAVKGLEVWGVFGLFDLGSDPREDAYCGAAAGYGPAVYQDSLREKYPEEIPLDIMGIRRECGPIRLRDPAIRRELIERLTALMDQGYAGLLLYTYAENLSLWHEGEFGTPLEREEVEAFLRELKSAMKGRKLGLQVDAREAFRQGPAPWLGLTPNTNTVGQISVAWEDWARKGLLDEVVFSIAPGAVAEATALCEEMMPKYPKVRFSLLTRETLPPESACPLTVDTRSSGFRAKFLERAEGSADLRAWAQGAKGEVPELASLKDSAAITATLAALAKKPSAEASKWLVEILKGHLEFPVRQQAADTLAAWKKADLIHELASSDDPGVRRVAYYAANKLEPFEKARPILERAVDDADAYNRWVGFRGLGRAPLDARMQDILIRGLADQDATVRCVAAWLVRPGQKVPPALFNALSDRFVALHDEETWFWEYRTMGDALLNCGAAGRAFLEKCLADQNDAKLADSSWRCLYIPQSGGRLELVTKAHAEAAYRAYPAAFRDRVPRVDK